MEGLFDSIEDYIEPEDPEPEVEILEESTDGVRSFYRPEFEWVKGSLWHQLHDAGITIHQKGH